MRDGHMHSCILTFMHYVLRIKLIGIPRKYETIAKCKFCSFSMQPRLEMRAQNEACRTSPRRPCVDQSQTFDLQENWTVRSMGCKRNITDKITN